MKTINFKGADFATVDGLSTALNVEREKYAKVPLRRDFVADYEVYQAWGYVIAAYFLLEQSLKLLAHMRMASPPSTHTLFELYRLLPAHDKDLLREYYRDCRLANRPQGGKPFRLSMLHDFLMELDGPKVKRKVVGHLDWRYYFIQNPRGERLPYVSVEFMHEMVFAILGIAEYAAESQQEPHLHTYSLRKCHERFRRHMDYLCA